MPNLDLLAVTTLVTFLSTAAQAATGFGFNLVFVPLLSLVYDPKATVVLALCLGISAKVPLLLQVRRHVTPGAIVVITLASFAGSLLGTRLILWADPAFLRFFIGLVVVAGCLPLLANRRWQIKRERTAHGLIGVSCGILASSTSMSGPPIILFGVNQSWPKESFRANLVAFFVFSDTFALATLVASGLLTAEIVTSTVLGWPAIAFGLVAGNWLFHRVPVKLFYKMVVLFVIIVGLIGLAGGASALLARA
ncbi:MAG: sulfite exporter TauE/SafE family protein [Chloroflexota bacterium]